MKEERGPPSWPPLASLPGEIRPEDGSKLKPNLVAYQVSLCYIHVYVCYICVQYPCSHMQCMASGAVDGLGIFMEMILSVAKVTTTVPFELDIVMETGLFSTVMSVSGERLSSALDKRQKTFDNRFESTFKLTEKVSTS